MSALDRRTLSGLILVPVVLVLADIASQDTALKFLLLPPFGALTYLVFVNPARVGVNLRRVVLCPTLTAVLAWLVASSLGDTPLSVALATIGTLLLMWALDARAIVPPLALELLTLLLHQQVRWRIGYLISVLIFTGGIYVLYQLWRRLPLDVTGQPQSGGAGGSPA